MCRGVMPDLPNRDFHVATSPEPHSQRRKAMLAKHGAEIRKLYGYDPSTAVQVKTSSSTML